MSEQIALVTGAGIGLGRATALALADAGYRVMVTDVLSDEGQAVVTEISERGGEAEFHWLDVTDTAIVDGVLSTIQSRYGALSALVLNAGIARTLPLTSLEDDAWDETMNINLKGMMRVMRAAIPGMQSAGVGSIVCLSSIVGAVLGWSEHIPYVASKGGVMGLVRSAALEFAGHGIRVNGIAPGVIRSAQTLDPVNSLGEDGLAAFAETVPLGRVGNPDDIADVAVFLLSDKARYLTGQIIAVDGGTTVSL
ncbi:SDR family oxidoreductase [Luminiphilus sp.]|nr:SDR family oxidoreductase [Luminiphilus sp.]|tara:strand:+ start:3762 stop:4517 length:756 start_codon:yes stop_codon:yes gene_type:complete